MIVQPASVQADGLAEDPVLSPASSFEKTSWGYVHENFTAPSETKTAIFHMEGYTGASIPAPTHYVRMSDDTLIAVHVTTEDSSYGTEDYVHVRASIRGTGCSEGQFDLFDRIHAWDGREVIEWTADRPWTQEKVGMSGYSYSGITAFHVASTQPPSLGAVSANMLIGDIYRDNAYPGGVHNDIFPTAWTLGLRPAIDAVGSAQGVSSGDEICAQNQAQRGQGHPADHPVFALTRDTDDAWYQVRSLITYADRIEDPIHIGHAWQDGTTGPRGGFELFRAVDPEPVAEASEKANSPKYLTTTNGGHGTAASVAIQQEEAFFDRYLLEDESAFEDREPVLHHVQTTSTDEGVESTATFGQEAVPDPKHTTWKRYFLQEDNRLGTQAPQTESATDTYVTGTPRPTAAPLTTTEDAPPNALRYRIAAEDEPRVIAGPLAADLFIASTATDFDLFVQVSDVRPDGSLTPLQKGFLKASHQALEESKTLYNDEGDIVRPYHRHTNPTWVTPGEVAEYNVEIWPIVHVLQPGHQLQVEITTPPPTDGTWGYEVQEQRGLNLVHRDTAHPSSVMVPFADWTSDAPIPGPAPCGEPVGYQCIQPATG